MTIEHKAQDPRFFSFMMTDERGFNSFFHVLQFYEEINDAEVERGTLDIDGIVKASHAKHEQNLHKKSGKSRDRQKTSKKLDESIFTNIDERQLLRATRLDRARPLLNALKKATTILPTESN